MMKPYDTVFSMAGHSVLPILALIHSNLSKRYVVMFSKELSENMEQVQLDHHHQNQRHATLQLVA